MSCCFLFTTCPKHSDAINAYISTYIYIKIPRLEYHVVRNQLLPMIWQLHEVVFYLRQLEELEKIQILHHLLSQWPSVNTRTCILISLIKINLRKSCRGFKKMTTLPERTMSLNVLSIINQLRYRYIERKNYYYVNSSWRQKKKVRL
jgi:hypothetical protein